MALHSRCVVRVRLARATLERLAEAVGLGRYHAKSVSFFRKLPTVRSARHRMFPAFGGILEREKSVQTMVSSVGAG